MKENSLFHNFPQNLEKDRLEFPNYVIKDNFITFQDILCSRNYSKLIPTTVKKSIILPLPPNQELSNIKL